MNYQRWEVRAQRSFRMNAIEILMRMQAYTPDGPSYIMEFHPHEIKEENERVARGYKIPDNNILTLPTEVAQNLMDELWICGLRPSEGTGSAGSLKATENHLKDMKDCYKDTQIYNDRLLKLIELEYACK
jgi:hypothetical protein